MNGKRKKSAREKDLTARYLSGEVEETAPAIRQRFSQRSASAQQQKIERTALLRASEEGSAADLESLPVGEVVQVFSLYQEVQHEGRAHLCVVRKTLNRLLESGVVVGDRVRFRPIGTVDEQGRNEGVIEGVLPRATVLTRADSFNPADQQPIVANAAQMLIVVSLVQPEVRWGLVDRMLVAAQGGGLRPIVCLNKVDLATFSPTAAAYFEEARAALAHYASLGLATLQTSAIQGIGLEELRNCLRDSTTVLAGHSGVGKSSLIRSIQPYLDLRIGAVSGYTGKGRHTTTSARRYRLDFEGYVIDTPGVKLFGLWGVTPERLEEFFPDVSAGSAPPWRQESYQRILESLGQGQG